MTAATESTNTYPRNRVLTTLMMVNTLLFALCGIINVTQGKALLSLIWFCGAILVYLNFLWSKKTPFIQFNEDGIILFPAMARPERKLDWDTIASLQAVSAKKVFLVLKSGERVKITLFSINKEDRVPLLRRLNAQFADTH